jgi:hypothetical protein
MCGLRRRLRHSFRLYACRRSGCDITSHYEGFFVKARFHLISARSSRHRRHEAYEAGVWGQSPRFRTYPAGRFAHRPTGRRRFVAADSGSSHSAVATGPARGVRGQTTIRADGPIHPVRAHSTLQQPGRLIPNGGVVRPIGVDPDRSGAPAGYPSFTGNLSLTSVDPRPRTTVILSELCCSSSSVGFAYIWFTSTAGAARGPPGTASAFGRLSPCLENPALTRREAPSHFPGVPDPFSFGPAARDDIICHCCRRTRVGRFPWYDVPRRVALAGADCHPFGGGRTWGLANEPFANCT